MGRPQSARSRRAMTMMPTVPAQPRHLAPPPQRPASPAPHLSLNTPRSYCFSFPLFTSLCAPTPPASCTSAHALLPYPASLLLSLPPPPPSCACSCPSLSGPPSLALSGVVPPSCPSSQLQPLLFPGPAPHHPYPLHSSLTQTMVCFSLFAFSRIVYNGNYID